MKKAALRILILLLSLSLWATPAIAAKASISFGGKLGLMSVGDQISLKVKSKGVNPDTFVWASSAPEIVSVSGGTIRALQEGRAIIGVQAGEVSAKCGVVVLPKSVRLAVGETYALPNGTLESYAVQDGKIAAVNKSGVIGAKAVGTTMVRVRYGKQTVYVEVEITEKNEAADQTPAAAESIITSDQSAAAQLDCANATNQIVLVDYNKNGSARLSIHEKKKGVWREIYNCTAYVGKNGIGKEREGDRKTPSGTYNLTMPFGIAADPGSKIGYTQVTKYHYWCGSSNSKYYNQLVDMRETDRKYTSSDEYLIEYGSAYKYCMFIDYNASGTPGKGSCIFLHCQGKSTTTSGCIAVPEKVMKRIIQWVEPGCKIVIR